VDQLAPRSIIWKCGMLRSLGRRHNGLCYRCNKPVKGTMVISRVRNIGGGEFDTICSHDPLLLFSGHTETRAIIIWIRERGGIDCKTLGGHKGALLGSRSDMRIEREPRLRAHNSRQCGTPSSQMGSVLGSNGPSGALRIEEETRLGYLHSRQRVSLSSPIGCVLMIDVATRLRHLSGRQRGTFSSRVGRLLGNKTRDASTERVIVESRLENRRSGQLTTLSGRIGGLLSGYANAVRLVGNWSVRTWVMELIGILMDVTVGQFRTLI
jgi:hypothetical protein